MARDYAGNKVDTFIYAVEKSLDSYKFNLLQNKQLFINQLKTNNLATRSIDEGALDEGTGINFAEYIAILSGNNDLLEKAKLEKKIAVIESQRQAFNRNKGADTLNYNNLLKSHKYNVSVIDRMTTDYNYFEKSAPLDSNGERPNPLKLDGVASTDYKVLGARLSEIDTKMDTGDDYVKIGTLFDFRILVSTEQTKKEGLFVKQNRFMVEGLDGIKYTYNNGYIANDPKLATMNFLNALNSIPKLIDNHTKKNVEFERDIPVLREISESVFKREDELQTLKTELGTLNKIILESLKKEDNPSNEKSETLTDNELEEDEEEEVTQNQTITKKFKI